MTKSQIIYEEALRYLGTKEVPGPASNPLIKSWIKAAADWLDGDDSKTAWCGCFRGAVGLNTGTGVPAEHFRASAWKTWGSPVKSTEAVPGDTAILSRRGGKHVALIHKFSPDRRFVYLLGGNQSDSVSIARFDAALIESIRR